MIGELKALMKTIDQFSETAYVAFRRPTKSETKAELLYQHISEYGEKNLNLIIETLGYLDENDPGFKKLCKSLHSRLTETLIAVDCKRNASIHKEMTFKAYKNAFAGIMQLTNMERYSAADYLEKALSQAIKMELSHLSLLILHKLIEHYGYIHPNTKKYNKYSKLEHRIHQNYLEERVAKRYRVQIAKIVATSQKSKRSELDALLPEIVKILEDLERPSNSITFLFDAFTVKVYYYQEHLRNPLKALEIIDSTLEKVEHRFSYHKAMKYLLLRSKSQVMIELDRYGEALTIIEDIESLQPDGSYNWIKMQWSKFVLMSAEGEYQRMYRLTSKMMQHPRVHKHDRYYEIWVINEAYIQFLMSIGKVIAEEKYPIRSVNLNRFINDIEHLKSDPSGIYSAVIIGEILHYLGDKKIFQIEERLEALKKYISRHLKNNDSLRHQCFLRMLMKLPEAEYHQERTQRYVKKYYERLINTPRTINTLFFDPEIIPYEDLWDAILELLRNHKLQTLSRKLKTIRRKKLEKSTGVDPKNQKG